MFKTISNIFRVEDLRRKLIFTFLMLIVFRIGSFVPVPGINVTALKDAFAQGNVFGILDTFSGNALSNFSIFAMGIMPYITASIIVNLLTMDVIPKFAQWAREGETGRRKLAQFTRYGTVVLGFVQAIGLTFAFHRQYHIIDNPSVLSYIIIPLILTAGTAFLMWLGEQITEKGIGNGISIIIFAGIVAAIPNTIQQIITTKFTDPDAIFINIITILIMVVVIIAIVVGVIFIQQGVRKIPVQYAKRVVGRRMYGGQSTHIPLKVNSAGVIPVIFAIALVMFPTMIAGFWADKNSFANWIVVNLSTAQPLGMFFYVLLIIGFTYFYTFVQINPVQLAENMKKNGGFIPGRRPGKETAVYLTRVINRITLTGAFFLAAVAVLPVFFSNLAGLPQSVQIGGTSLLIVIGVALETMKQIESQLIKRHYEGFIKK